MALVAQVLDSSRTHLNDENGLIWPDTRLLPKLQEAFRELLNKMLLVGIPVIQEVSAIITVPALTTDDANQDLSLVTNYPTDMIVPVWLKERQLGQMNADFVNMTQCDYIPNVTKSTTLSYWCYMENKIFLLGALTSNQVQIRYQRSIPVPNSVQESVVVTLGETFLSYRVAALAQASIRNWTEYEKWNTVAEANLDSVVRRDVKRLQNLPAKRRAYHRGRGTNRALGNY